MGPVNPADHEIACVTLHGSVWRPSAPVFGYCVVACLHLCRIYYRPTVVKLRGLKDASQQSNNRDAEFNYILVSFCVSVS